MATILYGSESEQIIKLLIPGNLICIAGRSLSGKTAVLEQLAEWAEQWKLGSTLLVSPEHPKNDFDNAPYISAETIRQHLEEIVKERQIDLVLIDSLQLLDDVEGDTGEGLKRMAVDLKLPVVVSCFLRRSAEKRPDKKPALADLADRTIERYADFVVMLQSIDR